jgi:hypothetical protein
MDIIMMHTRSALAEHRGRRAGACDHDAMDQKNLLFSRCAIHVGCLTFWSLTIWPGNRRSENFCSRENQRVAGGRSRLKGGWSQDWLPH